ncbi:N-6 DNA methylase [Novosphingobium subterraneum]|uniref:site-specific DNA-methyltransferase (adenine-specific) n=1 Tax=Novosphingobium subterraneum TaxID=48936 RepID=A0A0B8ZRR3_9SPHN|nr:N-6 DNA methylase [Novosphingobium subterraneum]KHS45840.1 N-6 DNA Methylase [Novosphingobium subterraneum]
MSSDHVTSWLEKLGYAAEPNLLHMADETIPDAHPYGLEIRTLLNADGAIRARAVFEVEGVPTVVFVGRDDTPLTGAELDLARKKIWNQNLATIVIEVMGTQALAVPARKLKQAGEKLALDEARPDGPFSALDVATANLSRRMPEWFDVKARVDRKLLYNLSTTVKKLTETGFADAVDARTRRRLAELLMGQLLFISYLEHREIVGETYRDRRKVSQLPSLVGDGDRDGLRSLIDNLRADFNGDFLGDDRHDPWQSLNETGFGLLNQFLRRTDMETGQGDFWNYDFSYIPVELLSGLYEKFLTPEEQAKEGAYYTPRNLAMLAVDQALLQSPDPLSETIFDGACGSGILLTTAYRRLLALSEADKGRKLGFAERGALLKRQIFGGDINFMACRVTAFSLYLSLLEGLDPTDILEAQERDGTKLPSLKDSNLAHGRAHADFFKADHVFAGKRFSLIISNPPWAEPEGESHTTADDWAAQAKMPFVRRQIAGAYALRASEFLAPGGRICLILPIGQLLGASSADFVAQLLRLYCPERLINFGDLQGLLFPTAENTCHVFLGCVRDRNAGDLVPFGETFEYLVPKADLSLALGRLTMQSADRHQLQTRSVTEDPQLLVTMMWGDASDLAIWSRLSVRGTFGDFWGGPRKTRRWTNRKGIHLQDKSRDAVDAAPLRKHRFIPIAALSAGSPVLHPALLTAWPANFTTVVGLSEEVRAVFDGPRVVFPDGFSRGEQNIRAVYYDKPASFTHSVGVIAGPKEDAALLKFAAVYLRSTLARYFLMMRGWKMLCERNSLHLADVEPFPFFAPEHAPDPDAAAQAIAQVAARVDAIAGLEEIEQAPYYQAIRDELDEAIFTYFGLEDQERALIRETVTLLMPSIRPRSFKSLDTPAQHLVEEKQLGIYARVLAQALSEWRERMGGRGRFKVEVASSDPSRAGPSGIVRVLYENVMLHGAEYAAQVSDELVLLTLDQLRRSGLRTLHSGDFLTLVPDARFWVDGTLYLVRPLTKRSWTVRQALRDATRIVRDVQSAGGAGKPVIAA